MTVSTEQRKIGSLLTEGIPEIPSDLKRRLRQYQQTREAHFLDWLPARAGLLISMRAGNTAQIHQISSPGMRPLQLTSFLEPLLQAQTRPGTDRQQFVFSKDSGGNESYQLYLFDLESRDIQRLTDGQSKNDFPVWNNRGDCLAYTTTGAKGTGMNPMLCYPDEPGEYRLLKVENKGYWYPLSWSYDDRFLTLMHYSSIADSLLYVYDTWTDEARPVVGHKAEKVSCKHAVWSPDSYELYYSCDLDHQFLQLHRVDWVTGEREGPLTPFDWDIEQMCMAADGRYLAIVVNSDGYSRLHLLDLHLEELSQITELPPGLIMGLRWHPDEHRLAFSLNQANCPTAVFVLHLASRSVSKWTHSKAGDFQQYELISPHLINYPTFDSVGEHIRTISTFYFKPPARRQPFPVLIYIHGGPESQFRPFYSSIFQFYLKELGIAILAPNVRGSSGYGKEFLSLDNGYKREDAVQDIGKLLDWIKVQPELDDQRVAVMGGSYGGYMVLASMVHFSNRLRCGIDIVGISNFITFLKNTKSYRRGLRRAEYGDERDPAMRRHLERISPTTNAHKINKPIMIVQGLNDPRVPASEAEQMLKAIRRNGGEAWYLLAEDEGHGFRKKRNKDYFTQAAILFLQRHLLYME